VKDLCANGKLQTYNNHSPLTMLGLLKSFEDKEVEAIHMSTWSLALYTGQQILFEENKASKRPVHTYFVNVVKTIRFSPFSFFLQKAKSEELGVSSNENIVLDCDFQEQIGNYCIIFVLSTKTSKSICTHH
jgi:hypothetical protein